MNLPYFAKLVTAQKSFEFMQLLLQVLFVGMTIGLFRTVIPALSETRFNVPYDAMLLLGSFIVVFGLVKSLLNFAAGYVSDRIGRRKVLIAGWVTALPIPWMLAYATEWKWIVASTVLLGINQGLCWSMSQIMKLDIAKREYHGAAIGLNETFGYCGVALAGYLSAEFTLWLGIAGSMLWLGFGTVGAALLLGISFCAETKPPREQENQRTDERRRLTESNQERLELSLLCLAGLVEKFVDTLVWLIYPFFLYRQDVSLRNIGIITGVYGMVWGITQLFTGHWSDTRGRIPIIVAGMLLCAFACTATLWSMHLIWWLINAALAGLGMAMLYPTLSAAVSDRCHSPQQRGTVMGIYRFWRDFGYSVGALLLTVTITFSGEVKSSFWVTTLAMTLSAISLFIWVPNSKPKH